MIRSVLVSASFLSLFLFPYPLTVLLSFAASIFFPPTAFLVGLFGDLLYGAPLTSMLPVATLGGAALSIGALFVRRFVKTRIMHA